jgi:hypothetical protein
MQNTKTTLKLALGGLFSILVATSALGHSGDHDGNFAAVASHMITSPWHQFGWLFAATCAIGILLVRARFRKASLLSAQRISDGD